MNLTLRAYKWSHCPLFLSLFFLKIKVAIVKRQSAKRLLKCTIPGVCRQRPARHWHIRPGPTNLEAKLVYADRCWMTSVHILPLFFFQLRLLLFNMNFNIKTNDSVRGKFIALPLCFVLASMFVSFLLFFVVVSLVVLFRCCFICICWLWAASFSMKLWSLVWCDLLVFCQWACASGETGTRSTNGIKDSLDREPFVENVNAGMWYLIRGGGVLGVNWFTTHFSDKQFSYFFKLLI